MTSEAPDESKATSGASDESSGERSEPRDSEPPDEPEGSEPPDEPEDSEPPDEPEDSEPPDEPEDSEPPDGTDGPGAPDGDADEIPLDIAGHEDRDPPSASADGLDLAGGSGDAGETSGAAETDDVGDGTGAAGGGTGAADGDIDSADDDVALDHGPYPEDVDAEREDEEEVEPIELLVQLAKDGEIDPWDVDVVAVTEEFLAALEDGDLRQSGRALFYASVLVRMKSDVLLEDPEEAPDEEPWDAPIEAPADAPPAFDPVVSLEEEMERRLQRKHVRGTPETLDELVRELREAERGSWWKESREYDTSSSPSGFDRGTQTVDYHADDARRRDGEPTAGEVTERTHGADIEGVIDDVRATLTEHYDAGRPEVLFREVEDAGGSRVQTFLAVLFLANRGEVRLQQDELFGDLWIQDPTADLGVEGAVAD